MDELNPIERDLYERLAFTNDSSQRYNAVIFTVYDELLQARAEIEARRRVELHCDAPFELSMDEYQILLVMSLHSNCAMTFDKVRSVMSGLSANGVIDATMAALLIRVMRRLSEQMSGETYIREEHINLLYDIMTSKAVKPL